MTDSLFLMKRYWGSDEEEANESEIKYLSDPQFEVVSPQKKQKLYSSVREIIEIDSDVEILDKALETESSKSTKGSLEFSNGNLKNSFMKMNLRHEDGQHNFLETQDELMITKTVSEKAFDKGFNLNNLKKQKKLHQPNEETDIEIISSNSTVSQDLVSEAQKSKLSSETKRQSNRKKETINKGKENDLKKESALQVYDKQPGAFLPIGKSTRQNDLQIKPNIPNWLSNPTYIEVDLKKGETPVSELNYLDSNSKKNLLDAGISYLFPVQLSVIPWLMQSKEHSLLIRPSDICVSAPTGSGKTLAFVLPIVQSLKDRVVCCIRALIVLPVNELAIQVYKVFETFIKGTDLKVALLTGQKSFVAEQNVLVKDLGNKVLSLVDIIVTTPGRVTDHILRTKGFCLKRLRYLVIDEADRMMVEIQQGWLKQVEEAVLQDCRFPDCVCNKEKRLLVEPTSAFNFGIVCQPLQKLLYSATLTHNPEQLHSLALYKPKLFTTSTHISEDTVAGKCTIPHSLKMTQVICDAGIKPIVVCHLIKKHNFKKVLCFTESVERAHRLHLVLDEMRSFEVREISSFNRAVQRKIVFEQFVSGKVTVLICSDLVARGIDIEDVDCVISYDVPQFVKIYIHRIGRTARAGKSGTAVTLLSQGQVPHFRQILKSAGIVLPELINVTEEDLEPFVTSYRKALISADTKLKSEKTAASSKSLKKKRGKKKVLD